MRRLESYIRKYGPVHGLIIYRTSEVRLRTLVRKRCIATGYAPAFDGER